MVLRDCRNSQSDFEREEETKKGGSGGEKKGGWERVGKEEKEGKDSFERLIKLLPSLGKD